MVRDMKHTVEVMIPEAEIKARIAELESRDKEIDADMENPEIFTNSVKCQALAKDKDGILSELEELYEQWELLAE